jgi:pimeloyl-ACP methyl ester carboxylesterase
MGNDRSMGASGLVLAADAGGVGRKVLEKLRAPDVRAYDRYHVPASRGIFWDSVLANFIPGPQDTAVDYHNDARAPLLFISGSEDHLMPPAVQRSNAKHYKSNTLTEIREFSGRSHLMPAQQGWEEIADYALAWAEEHATHPPQAAPASS